ncbi:MAG: SagB/ThcOx family dehydrogenase [Cyanobacteria bacterium J06639_14]
MWCESVSKSACPIVHRVEGLESGLYHHAIEHHKLELVKPGDLRQPLIKAGLNQDFLGEAQVCFVVSGIFQRTRWKYHERTYRYVLTEVGHLGQNFYLAATALGLGVCCIGAFFDDPLNQLLDIDGQEEAALDHRWRDRLVALCQFDQTALRIVGQE